jgi:hypothetical protein
MESARLLPIMTKEKCAAVFRAVRNLAGGVPFCGLVLLALAAGSTGCITNRVKDFTPKQAMVCDEVRITGKFHKAVQLDGVWFSGVPANAFFRHFPAPKGPLEILAVVPEGASNGPIRVKISAEDDLPFLAKGTDHTFDRNFIVTGSPPVPAINSFSAHPAIIEPGQTCELQWQVSPAATHLTLDGADVSGTTSKTVSPTATTYYALVAKGDSCLQQRQTLAVTVMPSTNTASGNPVNPSGDALAASGKELAPTNEPSPVTPAPEAALVASNAINPSAHQITEPKPAPPAAVAVSVPAAAVSSARHVSTPAPDTGKDGPFVDIKAKIGLTSQTGGSRQLQVSTNGPDAAQPYIAVFQQGGVTLAQHNFTPGIIGGAALSPGGDQAVVVTADPNGFSASYEEMVERFATHYRFPFPVNIVAGSKTATNRWHVLFSPDDTLVMVSTVPVGGPGTIAIQVHDLVRQKNVGPLIQASCAACDLQGEVINGNTVRVKLDGAVVATFPIH